MIGFSQLLTCQQPEPLKAFCNHPSVNPDCIHSFLPHFLLSDGSPDSHAIEYSFHHGINYISCQSLFYKDTSQLFQDYYSFLDFASRISVVSSLSSSIGSRYLILGSPSNRQSFNICPHSDIINRFSSLNDILAHHNQVLCIEPVHPLCTPISTFGFCETLLSTLDFVKSLGLPHIKVNADLAMYMFDNGYTTLSALIFEKFLQAIDLHIHYIPHVHLSLPGLIPFSSDQQTMLLDILAATDLPSRTHFVYEVM